MQQIRVVDIERTASQDQSHGEKCKTAQYDQHGITSIKEKGERICPPFCSFWSIGYKWILVSFLARKLLCFLHHAELNLICNGMKQFN